MIKIKQRKSSYQRKRPIVVSFRLSMEEYIKLKELILLSAKSKNQFIIDALLNNTYELRGGILASTRLSLAIEALKDELRATKTTNDLCCLLQECKELVCQLISLQK